jgi:hypothetical protein
VALIIDNFLKTTANFTDDSSDYMTTKLFYREYEAPISQKLFI